MHWQLYPVKTRSSATAEKERASSACLPRLANWSCSCSAQNTADSQRLYYFLTFKRSDSRSAGRKRILTFIQGHSFCNQLPANKG